MLFCEKIPEYCIDYVVKHASVDADQNIKY